MQGIIIFLIILGVLTGLVVLWALYLMICRPARFIPGFTYQNWRWGDRART